MKKYCLLVLLFIQPVLQASPFKEVQGPILETTIHVTPLEVTNQNINKIKPGTDVKLSAVIKNSGDVPSASGKIFLRFSLPKPLDQDPQGILFQTDTENFPSIPPGETLTINFNNTHQWPSLFEYIRDNWATREYEAIITIHDKKYLTGSLPVTFSAYYYEGPTETKPTRVSSEDFKRG